MPAFTIETAAQEIRSGRLTPVDLLELCLKRIDQHEDRVRAWVFVDREAARHQAESLTDELNRGWYRGPLHGIPIGIKDIFDVFDWPTAAGSKRWANSIARRDAPSVARLRSAGAVFVGKTVTTQYASFDPPITRNPWHHERTPGGSSSGSAAAVATDMCFAAMGSQTGGSITRPASYCGVCGLKPTYGRISLEGIVPLAPSMDHPGPMARCVHDLALLLRALACAEDCSEPVPDHVAHLDREYPPRLGRLRGLFEDLAAPPVREMVDAVVAKLVDKGATVVDVALPAEFSEVLIQHRIIMAVEAATFHEPRIRRYPDDYDANIRALIEEGLKASSTEYARSKDHQQRLTERMRICFEGVDALLCPSTTMGAPDRATTGDPAFNSPWSFTGFPSVSIPCGHDPDGLPLGVQFVGRAFAEEQALSVAAWCEKALDVEVLTPALDSQQ